MQTCSQTCYNTGMSKKRKLPPIGSLIQLRPYHSSMDFVKVESLTDPDTVRDFPLETIAMVIDHGKHPDHIGSSDPMLVPVVLVDGFAGWIFEDEWMRMPSKKRAS